MRKNPSYMPLLRPTCLLISEKSATYTIIWSYPIIWQVIVFEPIFAVVAIRKEKRPVCLFFFELQPKQKSKQRNLVFGHWSMGDATKETIICPPRIQMLAPGL